MIPYLAISMEKLIAVEGLSEPLSLRYW